MNIREWFFPLVLAMSITFAFQYFIGTQLQTSKQEDAASGQSFVAPELKTAYKPLLLDVEFAKKEGKILHEHVVHTALASYTFSSRGAVLTSLDVKWQDGNTNISMLPTGAEAFLIGLQGQTPLYYDFVDQYDVDGQKSVAVEYRAALDKGFVKKTFILHQGSYQIDVNLSFDGVDKDFSDQVRLFYPMTVSIDGSSEEVKTFKNKVSSKGVLTLQDINLAKQAKEFVFEPQVLGFSNKFIVQSFIDSKGVAPLRGFFKHIEDKKFDAILESPVLSKYADFTWSFYFGPKTEKPLSIVSPVLTETLDYGWLTFIAKPMLSLLQRLEDLSGSYGWAIIMLTMLLKLLMLPFSWKSQKSMQKQKELDKKIAYLSQKHKHDKTAFNQAKTELIMKHGLPGLSGMIPGLLNIPFFIALNRVLSSSVELYGAKFLWLADLSASDPYYILGSLTGMCMFFVLGSMGPAQRFGFALFIGTVSTYLSSGLALFILMSTFLGALQQGLEQSKFVSRLMKRS